MPAGQHLVRHHAKGKDVRAFGRRASVDLLRGRIGHEGIGGSRGEIVTRADDCATSEGRPTVGAEDYALWCDVAMDEAAPVVERQDLEEAPEGAKRGRRVERRMMGCMAPSHDRQGVGGQTACTVRVAELQAWCLRAIM